MRAHTSLALVSTLLWACGASGPHLELHRVPISGIGPAGLSGTARDGHGRLWAIPERERAVYRIDGASSDAPVAVRVRLEGVPTGVDLESIAWLGPGRFAFGTEGQVPRDADRVLWAQRSGDVIRVTGSIELSWRRLYGIEAPTNAGIEGLCFAGGLLLAGGEPVITEGGHRWAPVARLDTRTGEPGGWEPLRLRLTSPEGKLSSLDCAPAEDGRSLDVLAIERHYGVARVLRFALPMRGGPTDLVPRVVADLSNAEDLPNMEGLSRSRTGLLIVTDADTVSGGATETILLAPLDEE